MAAIHSSMCSMAGIDTEFDLIDAGDTQPYLATMRLGPASGIAAGMDISNIFFVMLPLW